MSLPPSSIITENCVIIDSQDVIIGRLVMPLLFIMSSAKKIALPVLLQQGFNSVFDW
jgi:hypothetical protein